MADLQAAAITQLRNIQTKTGKTLAELHQAVLATGLARHGERRSWLMQAFGLGHGDANAVVHMLGKPLPDLGASTAVAAASLAPVHAGSEALDAIYAGAKAHLRPLHEQLMAALHKFGSFEEAPKKDYISLRRKRQFAMLGPATKTQIELGLNASGLPASTRLKQLPPGRMCQYAVRLGDPGEIDKELLAWARSAFEAAA